MKIRILVMILACASTAYGQSIPDASHYADKITPSDLKDYLSILASDALEGRATGSRGQKMAAAFISYHFNDLNLQGPVNGEFYQPIDLYSFRLGETYIKVGGERFDHLHDFIFPEIGNNNIEKTLPVVFIGHGTQKDFQSVDVKGKAVMLLSKPKNDQAMDRAYDKGALVVLKVSTTKEDFETRSNKFKGYSTKSGLMLNLPNPAGEEFKTMTISPALAEKITKTTFVKLKRAADDTLKSVTGTKKIKLSSIEYKISTTIDTSRTENVLGYLEGTDKKDEVIVISAHYDHIGKNNGGTGDIINNGADDDGSGTVAVMAIAKAFAKAKEEGHGPRRSILFLAVTGEELGLYGSSYYTDHPVFPLKNTVADLNIDMVGRRDPQHKDTEPYVYVIGSDKLSSELHTLSEQINHDKTKLILDYTYNDQKHPERLYYRSDHWNFAKNNVPIIFYFDGIHEDYHKVSDEVEKIDFDLLTQRARLVFYTAWEIANREKRIEVDGEKMIKP